jgi:hypothetical protein
MYVVVGVCVMILACGCISANQPDPETGVIAWIHAINAHDVSGLYNLAPESIRDQVSLNRFSNANANNSLLTQDKAIVDYKVLNETRNETMANLHMMIVLKQNVSANSTQTETIPLYLNFEEWYESGEWKVWTIPWS